MSMKSFLWQTYWAKSDYSEDIDTLLDDWGTHCICLNGWAEGTVEKYKKMIRVSSKPHLEVFNKWLRQQGYEEIK